MEHVIRLYATAFLKHEEGWASYHEVRLVYQGTLVRIDSKCYWQHGYGAKFRNRREENAPLHKFLLWTLDYFSPSTATELYSLHPCIRSFINFKPPVISGFVEQGTYHERLEALLQLCKWLADKATADEIKTLLSQD